MTRHPITVRDWLSQSSLSRTDAEPLLCHVLGQPRSFLFAHSGAQLSDEQVRTASRMSLRRLSGEPLAYITGTIEFWSLMFNVTPAVLIPRDDTGCLVEVGLGLIEHLPDTGAIVDAGTGAGVIAIALAHETGCNVTAIDRSEDALRVAEDNAARLTPGLIECRQGNWLEGFDSDSVRLLLANPPYIAEHDPHLEAPELQHEPSSALVSGPDGLDDIRTLAEQAENAVMSGGALAFEHGFDQGEAVRHILLSTGFKNVTTISDLAGHERVTFAIAG